MELGTHRLSKKKIKGEASRGKKKNTMGKGMVSRDLYFWEGDATPWEEQIQTKLLM